MVGCHLHLIIFQIMSIWVLSCWGLFLTRHWALICSIRLGKDNRLMRIINRGRSLSLKCISLLFLLYLLSFISCFELNIFKSATSMYDKNQSYETIVCVLSKISKSEIINYCLYDIFNFMYNTFARIIKVK